MQTAPEQRRQELAALYGGYNDEFLLRTAEEELTDLARAVVQEEIGRRGLSEEFDARAKERHLSSVPQRLVVWSGRTMEEAAVALHTLELANMDASLTAVPGAPPKQRFQISVVARDAETALGIVATGMPTERVQDLVSDFLQSSVAPPPCERCGSAQVAFESSREGNCWSCEDCNHTWEEVPSEEVQAPLLQKTARATGQQTAEKRRFVNRSVIALVVVASVAIVVATLPAQWSKEQIAGTVLWGVGGLGWATARWQLGSSFTAKAEARELVTTGLYRRIQNPIYISGAFVVAGMALYLQRPWFLLLLLVLIPLQIKRVRKERRVLTHAFGEQYLTYRQQTWF